MRRHLLPLLLALIAPGLAGCQIKQYPADKVTRAQSPEYDEFRNNDRPPPPAGFGGVTLPSGRYLQHPPQYFPPDPVFPLQREPLVVPKSVAPPTAEQVNAVSPDVVKFLQTGAFDPNFTASASKPTTPPIAPANALDGTVWVRETKGCRVVLRLTKDRIDADVTAPNGVSLAVAADYALGKDGLLFGVVTEASCPEAEERGLAAKLLAADGAPYCVRARIDGDTLTVRDLRCGTTEATYAVLGAYKKTTAAGVEKLPPVAGAIPAELNRLELPREDDGRKWRTNAAPRSSLEAAADFARTFAAENPQLVKFAATELGRVVGGRVGDEVGHRRTGEAVGATVAATLTGAPATTDFRSVRALSYWLGATPVTDAPKP